MAHRSACGDGRNGDDYYQAVAYDGRRWLDDDDGDTVFLHVPFCCLVSYFCLFGGFSFSKLVASSKAKLKMNCPDSKRNCQLCSLGHCE